MSRFQRAASGMSLAEHLAELRQRLLWIVGAICVFGVVAFIGYPQILRVLQHPYCAARPDHCAFLVTNPLDGLTLRVKIALVGGFVFSFPLILWHTWRFVTPGLKSRERRYALPFIAVSIVFFAVGVVVAYYSFGHAISFLSSIGGKSLVTEYNPNQYLTLFVLMMVIFGLTFEFPVVLVALELAGVVTPATLLRGWRYAIVTITVAAALFTPSGDPFSMMVLAVPLCAFYFIAIGVGKLFGK
jgi:sec-independent protein translocase protein TatC